MIKLTKYKDILITETIILLSERNLERTFFLISNFVYNVHIIMFIRLQLCVSPILLYIIYDTLILKCRLKKNQFKTN